MAEDDATLHALTRAVKAALPSAIADLTRLVAIPSVSWPSFDQEPLQRSAEAIAELARTAGVFDSVGVHRSRIEGTEEDGQPAVLALSGATTRQRRVLLYAHHDVQPPGDEQAWLTSPFEATEVDGRLYGRGTADDKAGVLVHLTALRAVAEVMGPTGLGVCLFVEGEEEYGSRSFTQFLSDHRDALDADLIVVADSSNPDTVTGGLTVSLRGNVRFTLTVSTLAHGLHSGMFGGAVPDAMMATITLLATLWDADGSVDVAGLSSVEAATLDYDEPQLRAETDLLAGTRPIGRGPLLSRIWHQPSITVTGIDHTAVAEASNTLSAQVSVVISARVAPGQNSTEAYQAIRAHLEQRAPFGASLEFSEVDCGEGFWASQGWGTSLGRQALTDSFGTPAVDLGVGGSIPFISELAAEFPDAEILVTGVLDPLSSPHSPNESLDLGCFERAILAEALLLARIASA